MQFSTSSLSLRKILQHPPIVLLLLLYLVGGLIAFSQVLQSSFLSDDLVLIWQVAKGGLYSSWGQAAQGLGFFRPAIVLSYWIDLKIWGYNPLGFHLTNILFHSLNAFLIFIFCRAFLQISVPSVTSQFAIPFISGLLFLLHPSHTESVSWIAGRTDVIAVFFILLSLSTFVLYLLKRSRLLLLLCMASFGLALLSKENAIVVPFIFVVIGIIKIIHSTEKGRDFYKLVMASGLSLILLGLYLYLRFSALGAVVGGYGTESHLAIRLSDLVTQIRYYIIRSLLPAPPIEHSMLLMSTQALWIYRILMAGFVVLMVVGWFTNRRSQIMSLLAMVVCAGLAVGPSVTIQVNLLISPEGERFIYFPSVFSTILITSLVIWLCKDYRVWIAILGGFAIFYGVSLQQANERWAIAGKLAETIIEDIAKYSQSNFILVLNIPDNYQGAYIFRNGLQAAIPIMQGNETPSTIMQLSTHNVVSPTDRVTIEQDGTSFGQFMLRLENDYNRFREINSTLFQTEQVSATQFNFRFLEPLWKWTILSYDQGQMKPIWHYSAQITHSNGTPLSNVTITDYEGKHLTTSNEGHYTILDSKPIIHTHSPMLAGHHIHPTPRLTGMSHQTIGQIFVALPKPVSISIQSTTETTGISSTLSYSDTQHLPTTLHFPKDVVSQDVTVVLTPTIDFSPMGTAFTGHAFDLGVYQDNLLQPNFAFNQPVTTTIHYSELDVRLISDENALVLWWWDGDAWTDIGTICSTADSYSRNLDKNQLQVTLCGSGRYVLAGPTYQLFMPIVAN